MSTYTSILARSYIISSLILHKNLVNASFVKGSCSEECDNINTFFILLHQSPLVCLVLKRGNSPIYNFVTLYSDHLELSVQ